jgi:hypothetical protein
VKSVNVSRETLHEFARPGKADQCYFRGWQCRAERSKGRHRTQKVAKLQRPQDNDAPERRRAGKDAVAFVVHIYESLWIGYVYG